MGKTKSDLAEAVYRVHGGLSRQESRRVIDVILSRIRNALAEGDSVLISGFGTFKVQKRRPRIGRNPRTGSAVPIAASRRPIFRPSRLVLQGMNRDHGRKERSDA